MTYRARSSNSALALCALVLAACAVDTTEPTEQTAQGWDSAEGNPGHATHSYMMELAIDRLHDEFPELEAHRADLISGTNAELHELPLDEGDRDEPLRGAIEGSNWACNRPQVLWSKATERYAAGDTHTAYRYAGILAHYVQDMSVPAHAFHVIHQSPLKGGPVDHLEERAFFRWSPNLPSDLDAGDPQLADPAEYVAFAGEEAKRHFWTEYPGRAYRTDFFSLIANPLTSAGRKQSRFISDRQGGAATVTYWAVRTMARAFRVGRTTL
jgi:hypothetical protein